MNEFVSYLNTLHNASASNEGAYAENIDSDKDIYSGKLKFDRKITEQLYDTLILQRGKIVILTGHAGDGKTRILQEIIEKFTGNKMDVNEKEIEVNFEDGKKLLCVKDMSEHEKERQIALMKRAIDEQNIGNNCILISNTGPLFNVLLELGVEEEKIIQMLDHKKIQEISCEIEKTRNVSVIVANLALFDNSDIVDKYIKNIVNPQLWVDCEDCSKREYCPIYFNQRNVRGNLAQVVAFSKAFYRWNFEHDERFTVRQMIAHIAYAFTGNCSCKGMRRLQGIKKNQKRKLYNSFSNLFFGNHYEKGLSCTDRKALQIKPIEKIKKQALDSKKVPQEYELFVQNNFTAFSQEVEELVKICWKSWHLVEEEEQKQELLKVIKRAYFMYHIKGEEENKVLLRSVYSPMFLCYMGIQKGEHARGEKIELKKMVSTALQNLFVGLEDKEAGRIYMTVKRKGEIRQNVQISTGYIEKSDIQIEICSEHNEVNGENERYIVLECRGQREKLTLPMLEYFDDIRNGMLQNKVDPRLSQGVENIKAKIYQARKKKEGDGLSLIYSDGAKIRNIELYIEGGKIYKE